MIAADHRVPEYQVQDAGEQRPCERGHCEQETDTNQSEHVI